VKIQTRGNHSWWQTTL